MTGAAFADSVWRGQRVVPFMMTARIRKFIRAGLVFATVDLVGKPAGQTTTVTEITPVPTGVDFRMRVVAGNLHPIDD